ncbi:hypothetical protein [Geosporobacter ferrireducens]|uniref:Uncharacterized protein n=1 Tax=Geosporobacter ferrireducens TaxID=1424294 RepID=A0A1D8GPJ5_9FIRM|nr:hypothetical protein [Geosporobacter ferrireducens]AOT72879.1 hypothetical protein Gferi_26980 [Geosporobacter ferrireducens]MTI55286.1 hypothetical protein [Geosporobacter ferrireducens]
MENREVTNDLVVPKNKKRTAIFLLFSLFCVVSLGASYIVDFANHDNITWSAYVFCAVPLAWVVALPLFMAKGKKHWFSLLAFSVVFLPFLYFLERAIDSSNWFLPIGLPVGTTVIFILWAASLLLKLAKINKWYLTAGIIAVGGFAFEFVAIRSVVNFLGRPLSSWVSMAAIFVVAVISLLIVIIGYIFDK